ncbi:N-acetyltransferase [Nakamurella endophytica]|uniref:N-acetyltransferase n=1 Tax=Nakamurella endophytica TaxID=1748367 RepID=A0A917WCZ1_9ACTN|nr:N-acetyltransferase [Nakamurella endophytica]GGL95948.1 hypothetical protein GCM10011594_14550 [Nakamurella endophytica]
MRIHDLAARPDLADAMWAMPNLWPPFLLQDPLGVLLFARLPEAFPEYQLVAVDDAGSVVGKVNALPFAWSGSDDDLPASGWDGILQRGFAERAAGTPPTAASLLEARVNPEHRGTGLAATLLTAARETVGRLGLRALFGPVRPTRKAEQPLVPMADYVRQVRDDGLPADPWIRAHARLGARVVSVCPASMTVAGDLASWRRWTGLPFDRSGPLVVPDALVPVHVSVEHDHAAYVEPNVWMHHPVAGGG